MMTAGVVPEDQENEEDEVIDHGAPEIKEEVATEAVVETTEMPMFEIGEGGRRRKTADVNNSLTYIIKSPAR